VFSWDVPCCGDLFKSTPYEGVVYNSLNCTVVDASDTMHMYQHADVSLYNNDSNFDIALT